MNRYTFIFHVGEGNSWDIDVEAESFEQAFSQALAKVPGHDQLFIHEIEVVQGSAVAS